MNVHRKACFRNPGRAPRRYQVLRTGYPGVGLPPGQEGQVHKVNRKTGWLIRTDLVSWTCMENAEPGYGMHGHCTIAHCPEAGRVPEEQLAVVDMV